MLRSLFSGPARYAIRGVHLYFSKDSVIVAATHQNRDGVYYEQPVPLVLPGHPVPAQLGAAFQGAFQSFSVQDKDLGTVKRSEAPAYRASGARSLRDFEGRFRPMQCYGLHASNAVVRASMAHPVEEDIELSISFNPQLAPEEIGDKLLRLARAANAA